MEEFTKWWVCLLPTGAIILIDNNVLKSFPKNAKPLPIQAGVLCFGGILFFNQRFRTQTRSARVDNGGLGPWKTFALREGDRLDAEAYAEAYAYYELAGANGTRCSLNLIAGAPTNPTPNVPNENNRNNNAINNPASKYSGTITREMRNTIRQYPLGSL